MLKGIFFLKGQSIQVSTQTNRRSLTISNSSNNSCCCQTEMCLYSKFFQFFCYKIRGASFLKRQFWMPVNVPTPDSHFIMKFFDLFYHCHFTSWNIKLISYLNTIFYHNLMISAISYFGNIIDWVTVNYKKICIKTLLNNSSILQVH